MHVNFGWIHFYPRIREEESLINHGEFMDASLSPAPTESTDKSWSMITKHNKKYMLEFEYEKATKNIII